MGEVSLGKLETEGYRWAYGLNRFNMGIIGTWPEDNENWIVRNRAYIYSLAGILIIWIPMTWSITFLLDDLKALVECLVIMVPVGLSFLKLALFRVRRDVTKSVKNEFLDENKKVIVTMLVTMAKDWAATRSNEELEAMKARARYGRFISVMSVSLSTSMFFAFASGRAWAAKYERQLITNETVLAIGFLYPAYFPYDTRELKEFLLTWIAQLFGTAFSMIGYAGPDSLMAMIILHLCGQLATLRIALANIVDEESLKTPSVYWQRLSSIIKRHEELNSYGALLEGAFNGMLLIQMVLCTLTFCFQGFVTITMLIAGMTGDGDFAVLEMLFKVIHGFYTILHLFVYCWAGDLLVSESTSLSYAPYESDWFLLPPSQARALMIITHRGRIPLQLTAGKFVGFSLELFTSIMKTSMGYLSVLLAMQEG